MSSEFRSFRAAKLIIIESLRSNDWPSGQMLFKRLKELPDYSFPTELRRVATKQELIELLNRLAGGIAAYLNTPILHFVMHGDEEGLQVSSGEIITWEELANPIRSINIMSANNLLVTMATCKGLYLENVIIHSLDRSAFWAIIGIDQEYSGGDFTNDWARFYSAGYSNLAGFGDWDITEALKIIQQNGFHIRYSELIIFQIVQILGKSVRMDSESGFPEIREMLSAHSRTAHPAILEAVTFKELKKSVYDRYKTFLLLDMFPEHSVRYLDVEKAVEVAFGAEIPLG